MPKPHKSSSSCYKRGTLSHSYKFHVGNRMYCHIIDIQAHIPCKSSRSSCILCILDHMERKLAHQGISREGTDNVHVQGGVVSCKQCILLRNDCMPNSYLSKESMSYHLKMNQLGKRSNVLSKRMWHRNQCMSSQYLGMPHMVPDNHNMYYLI